MNVNPNPLLAHFATRQGLIQFNAAQPVRTQPSRTAAETPQIDGSATRIVSDAAPAPATPAATPTATESAQPVATPSVEPAATPQHRIDELLARWGQADEAYDLDGNGIVDGIDLGMLLGQLQDELGATPADPALEPPPAELEPPAQTPPHAQSKIDALLAEWGADGSSQFDLNGDNIVDGIDLGVLLAQLTTQPEAGDPVTPALAAGTADGSAVVAEDSPNGEEAGLVDTLQPDLATIIAEYAQKTAGAIFSALDQDGDGQIRFRELPFAPGLAKRFDQDGDGAVSQRALTAALSDRFENLLKHNVSADLNSYAQRLIDAFTSGPHRGRAVGHERAESARLDRVADRLADRLSKKALKSESVPAIRETIDQLDLPQGIKQNLLRKVDARLPRGLSFHAVG